MSASPMRLPTITLDDDAWEDLLSKLAALMREAATLVDSVPAAARSAW